MHVDKSRQKALFWSVPEDTGFDLYWLAAAMHEAEKIELLPVKLHKSLKLQDMKKFYTEQRIKLLRRIVCKSGKD